ncbi:extracellular solute-binding protein [Chelatococcus sp. SYSU_G07232]|uniref:Extracellular solute-binding protein n=1 Tax=Chelatococcus albus TaxID=3047466 RepID=A0ABT7AE59_9HYPH|nr:extracellular solute-binding protein [Chelatococcus sp. SYSU_G07232]MDJ1157666.1 extracellular solute-binding protein [Chelatococcus sp. SYSU_G07232]
MLACLLVLAPGVAAAGDMPWRHALSLLGTPKYPADFPHFDYVNPDAPKGGLVRLGVQGGFDNFNIVVAGVKGDLEAGIGRLYDSLLAPSLDEASTAYGQVAEAVYHPDDYSSVTFRLRPQARFHDGEPIKPEDIIFSFEVLKANAPQFALYWKNVARAEKTGDREVTFTFDQKGNRELPQIVGQLIVLPKHWWEGTDKAGRRRDITQTTLEPPVGSGAYRLKSFEPGRYALYERVKDYWGKDLPVNRGTDNFDEVRYDYYRDATVLFEAFKGDRIDFRRENLAKNWSTAYDFPAVREGRVKREEFPDRGSGRMQAFVFNLRRDKFKDPRVRLAFNHAFDFEEANRTLFHGLYKRIDSYFFGTELASSGLPEGKEREILEGVRDGVPPEVFTTPYRNPVNAGPQAVRDNLREAQRLLQEAGYRLQGRQLVDGKTGAPFTVEMLGHDQSLERYGLAYKAALERIGITVTLRIVDIAQYQNRLRSFDFDVTTMVWPQSLSPGNEQRDFWGSAAADRPGSSNIAGIRNPAVDALIERIVYAKDREELVAATRALDRVLLWNHYVVPQWALGLEWTARWDRFARPEKLPAYGGSAFPTVWWWDAVRAARTGAAR